MKSLNFNKLWPSPLIFKKLSYWLPLRSKYHFSRFLKLYIATWFKDIRIDIIYVDGFIQTGSHPNIGHRLKEHKLFVDLNSTTIQRFNFHYHNVFFDSDGSIGYFVTLSIRDTTIDKKVDSKIYYLTFQRDDMRSASSIFNKEILIPGKEFC